MLVGLWWLWCWCFTQDCNGSGGNALGQKLDLGKWKLVSAGESKDVWCQPFVTTKTVVVPSISCFIMLRLGSILCRSPCLGISAFEGIGCHTFGSLWLQTHKWKDTFFFWIYHRWAALSTTQGYFPTNFQESIMLHQEAWFGDQEKSSQKRTLSDFIPWNFFLLISGTPRAGVQISNTPTPEIEVEFSGVALGNSPRWFPPVQKSECFFLKQTKTTWKALSPYSFVSIRPKRHPSNQQLISTLVIKPNIQPIP